MRKKRAVFGLAMAAFVPLVATGSNTHETDTRHVRRAQSEEKTFDGEARIVGGRNAQQGRYPYMVSLWSDVPRHECGGVMVAKDVVLTAAHCIQHGIDDWSVKISKAIIGRWDLEDVSDANSQVIETSRQLIHSWYNLGTDEHDVGLIKLVTPSNAQVMKLNSNPSLLTPGLTLTTIGWGDIYGNYTYQSILQETTVKYITNQVCENAPDPLHLASYFNFIYPDMMCAYASGSDNCYGDSGGPLFVKGATASDDNLMGVTSWGIGCARMPGVYARIDYQSNYNWIVSKVCNLSEDPPSYMNCDETHVGGIRDDSLQPTPRPTRAPTPAPTPRPTRAPTRRPGYSVGINLPSKAPTPRPGYSVGIYLPPALLPSPTAAQSETRDERGVNQGDMESSSSSTGGNTFIGVTARQGTASVASLSRWTTTSLWLMSISTVLVLSGVTL